MAFSILLQELLQTYMESNDNDCNNLNNAIHSHKHTITATQSNLFSIKSVASKPKVTSMLQTESQDWGRVTCTPQQQRNQSSCMQSTSLSLALKCASVSTQKNARDARPMV